MEKAASRFTQSVGTPLSCESRREKDLDLIATPDELQSIIGIKAATLRKEARDGKLQYAEKVCGRWLINATKQYPKLALRRDVK